jgi:hypothetical protein
VRKKKVPCVDRDLVEIFPSQPVRAGIGALRFRVPIFAQILGINQTGYLPRALLRQRVPKQRSDGFAALPVSG